MIFVWMKSENIQQFKMKKIRNAYAATRWLIEKQNFSKLKSYYWFFKILVSSYLTKTSVVEVLQNKNLLQSNQKEDFYNYTIILRLPKEYQKSSDNDWYENERFYAKFGSMSYDISAEKRIERNVAYMIQYKMGRGTWVETGVHILRQHPEGEGHLTIGESCIFSGNNKIDYTADLTIGNGVVINDGVSILTHGHQYLGQRNDYFEEEIHAYRSPLVIEDNVVIGANATILANVRTIGENSIISAGVVVNRPVPANTLVTPTGMKPIPNGMRTLYVYKK